MKHSRTSRECMLQGCSVFSSSEHKVLKVNYCYRPLSVDSFFKHLLSHHSNLHDWDVKMFMATKKKKM